jgi:hypothetical protein
MQSGAMTNMNTQERTATGLTKSWIEAHGVARSGG